MFFLKIKDKIKAILENQSFYDQNKIFIAYPEKIADLQRIIKLANKDNFKLLLFGSGSTLNKEDEIPDNIIYLSTGKLNKVIEYDSDYGYLKIQAGITFKEIEVVLDSSPWVLPLRVDMDKSTTLGGFISTCRSFSKFTSLICSIKAVLYNNEEINYGGKYLLNSSGYNLIKLFIGTFGNFGVLSEITIKLVNKTNKNLCCEKMSHLRVSETSLEIDDIFQNFKNKLDPQKIRYSIL